MIKLVTIIGARPQFVKAAAVSRAVHRWNTQRSGPPISEVILHTGQHYDSALSAVFFSELKIPTPALNLGIGSAGHGVQTGEMLRQLEPVLIEYDPDVVLVYGDTNSTLAGALAAAKLNMPLAHVEAGLRSGRRDMPEEINRVVTDHVAQYLFCPSEQAVKNLHNEGLVNGVHLVGDVMLDLLESHRDRLGTDTLDRFGLTAGQYALTTLHRVHNTENADRLAAIVEGLECLVERGLKVVLPLHPRTRAALSGHVLGVQIIEPTSYLETIDLAASARAIITDSGGLQKEAYWLGIPCVTIREETEWPETVASGWNTLVDSNPHCIVDAALSDPPETPRSALYGTGDAANQIVAVLTGLVTHHSPNSE